MDQHNANNHRYHAVSIGLHWLVLLLMIAVYAFIELRELFPKGSDPRETMKAIHFMLGMLILLTVLPRVIFRFIGTTPAITPEPPVWQHQAAKLTHLALYLFMIVMPLLGWLVLSAAGKPIPFFGLQLPALIEKNKELAKFIKEIHETVGEIGYYLIGLHALATLYHHYWQHDNTLTRMLPFIKPVSDTTETN